MNDIKKEIIDIIEPYMDKTLSEGCYIEFKYSYFTNVWYFSNPNKKSELVTKDEIYKIWDTYNSKYFSEVQWKDIIFYYYTDYDKIENETLIEIDKILWHYDISAVLKYIQEKRLIGTDLEKDWRYFASSWLDVPNRPLYLYTEQQDKDLLDLLKKLWNI